MEWERESEQLPPIVDDQGSSLVIYNTRQSDSGRYICRVHFIDGTSTENYVDVIIKSEYRRRRHRYH